MGGLAVPLMMVQADAALKEGSELYRQGVIQKSLNEVASTQAVAVGQQQALEEKRQAEIMASRAVAVGAAGGSIQDIDHLIADIHGEGMYRASLAMYEAETQAEQLRYQGEMAERTGRKQKSASRLKAAGSLMSGFGSAYANKGGLGSDQTVRPKVRPSAPYTFNSGPR